MLLTQGEDEGRSGEREMEGLVADGTSHRGKVEDMKIWDTIGEGGERDQPRAVQSPGGYSSTRRWREKGKTSVLSREREIS